MPSAAKRRSSHTTPLSTINPESASHSVDGTTPMPTTTTSAAQRLSLRRPRRPARSPHSPRRPPRPRRCRADAVHRHAGAQLHPVGAVQRAAVRAEHRSQHVGQRDVERLEHCDPAAEPGAGGGDLGADEPRPDDHDARRLDRGHRGAQGERVVERAQREEAVALDQALGSGEPAGRGARRDHDAVAARAIVPSSSSVFRPSTSSRTARRPSTSCTRSSLDRRLSASTAFSGGHDPASTCLDSGGRS